MAEQEKQEIATWWAENPMTYSDEVHGRTTFDGQNIVEEGKEFFETSDSRFYEWNRNLHLPDTPFGRLFPYAPFRGKDVLEIGCGIGCMAMNWARQGARVTAVDLNSTSIRLTRHRFNLYGLQGRIEQADGNQLAFDSASFDYVYSWGVLHHSPNLQKSLLELVRVLKPGGQFGIMLYQRNSVMYWSFIRCFEGWLHGESLFLNPLQLTSRYTDGYEVEGNPYTWPVTKQEIHDILGPLVKQLRFQILGTDLDYQLQKAVPIPGLANKLPKGWMKALARRWGWSLWIEGLK